MKQYYFLLALPFLICKNASAQIPKLIKVEETAKHIGDSVIITGQVYGTTQDGQYPVLIVTNSAPLHFVIMVVSKADFVYDPYNLDKVGTLSFVGRIEKHRNYSGVQVMKIYSPEQIRLTSAQLTLLKTPAKPLSQKQKDSLVRAASKIRRPVPHQ